MSDRPVIPLKVKSGKPSPEVLAQLDRHWRSRYLMLAPHRLGFFLAMVLLVASGVVRRIGEGGGRGQRGGCAQCDGKQTCGLHGDASVMAAACGAVAGI